MPTTAPRENDDVLEGRSPDVLLDNPLVELFARYAAHGARMGRRDMLLPTYVSGRLALRMDQEGGVLVIGAQEPELAALTTFGWREVVLLEADAGSSICIVSDGFGPQGLDLRVFLPVDTARAGVVAAEGPRTVSLRAAKVVDGEFRVSRSNDRRTAPLRVVRTPPAGVA